VEKTITVTVNFVFLGLCHHAIFLFSQELGRA